jgi:hypothetical protein
MHEGEHSPTPTAELKNAWIYTSTRQYAFNSAHGRLSKTLYNTAAEVLRKTLGPTRDDATGDWRDHTLRSFMICTLNNFYSGDHIQKNEMGMYGGEKRCI